MMTCDFVRKLSLAKFYFTPHQPTWCRFLPKNDLRQILTNNEAEVTGFKISAGDWARL